MKKVLFYTFRTFPIELIDTKDVFIFGKLKEDLKVFEKKILNESPDLIIGFGLVKGKSRFERIAINKFNNGVISETSPEFYNLEFPDKGFNTIKVSTKPTNSFCNWTMYKITDFLNEESLLTKMSFIHINKDSINDLLSYIHLLV